MKKFVLILLALIIGLHCRVGWGQSQMVDYFAQRALDNVHNAEAEVDRLKREGGTPEEIEAAKKREREANTVANDVMGAATKGDADGVVSHGSLLPPRFPKKYSLPLYATIMNTFTKLNEGCWFCPLFTRIYDSANNLATKIYNQLRYVFLSFLVIFTFGWILMEVLKFITTLHAPNIGEFMTKMFKTLGSVLLASAFLATDVSFLTGHLVEIPTLFAVGLSSGILEGTGVSKKGEKIEYISYKEGTTIVKRRGDDGSEYDMVLKAVPEKKYVMCKKSSSDAYKGKAMSGAMHDEISCLIKKVSVRMIKGIAVGATLVKESFSVGTFWAGLKAIIFQDASYVLPHWNMFWIGIFLVCAYMGMFVKVPFHLIDLVLRLCFVVIMLPVFVVCFPFASTRQYSKKGWDMLLSVLVHIISMCIFIGLALALIENGLKYNPLMR